MKIKTVVLYEKHKIRPETLLAIAEAESGALVPVEASELNAFLPIAVFIPDDEPAVAVAREAAKARATKEAKKGAA